MSSYNSIEKIKYTDDLSDAVSLDEYIVFGNERAEEKYIVFKFFNNVNQKLIGMKFEVSQYDMHDHLIEKSVVIYNNFFAKANSSFVPKAKLKVMYACKRISVRLVQAAFDRVLWNEGEYIDNSYKFEHYARDEKYIDEAERPKEEPLPPPRKKVSRDDTERFRSKDITKKNVAVFPKVFFWLTSILLVIAIGVAVWLFPKYSKRFTLAGYDLELMADDNVRICGYEGDEETLIVPKELEGYKIVGIGSGAFRYLSVRSVTLPDSITTIGEGAFRNLQNLNTVKCASENVTVDSLAFKDITSLKIFEMKGARLTKNCFYGCSNLSDITYGQTNVVKFVDLFGTESHTVKYISGSDIENPEEFFEGVKLR